MRQSSLTHENLLNLKPYFEIFLSSGCCEYSSEIQKYVTDSELPLPEEKERLDVLWNKVFKTNRYPVLSSLVRPCLSISTEPIVECSFSMMNNIIDSRSGHMEIETYSAIMTTKYSLKCSKSAAVKFNQKDILRDPVDSALSYYIPTSSSCYKKCLKTKRDKSIVEKSLSRSNKEEKKGNCTQAGYSFIYLWLYFRLKLKFIVWLYKFFSVIFCIQKEVLVCRLFPSSENSSYYENNPQYSCKFQKCFKFTNRSFQV